MPLPQIIKLEYDVYAEFENALEKLNVGTTFVTVCGTTYTKKIAYDFIENVKKYKLLPPIEVERATASAALKVQSIAESENASVIGFGGGKNLDVAKKGGSDAKKPVILVPTQPTHDGMASPVVSISAPTKPYSVSVTWPVGVLPHMPEMYKATKEAVSQGIGDSIAKITANLDWRLSAELKLDKQKDPAYNESISSLCMQTALKNLEEIKKKRAEGLPFLEDETNKKQFISNLVDTLTSYGIYMCTVGSSVCASGAEHSWTHALDLIASNYIPHGWGVGSGTLVAYGLYEKFRPDYCKEVPTSLNELRELAEYVGIPCRAKRLGITKEEAVYALLKAVEICDERGRITIFDDVRAPYREPRIEIDEKFAKKYLEEINFII